MEEDTRSLSKYITELIDSKFPQYNLLSESGLIRFLESRDVHISYENLEHFEMEGLLFPVLRLHKSISEIPGQKYVGVGLDAYSLKSYKEAGLLEYPSFKNFREWSSYKDGYENSVVMLYHPYQILTLEKIFSSISSVLEYSILENREELRRRFEEIKPFYEQSKEYFFKTLPNHIKRIGLLFSLQNAYQPLYRNSFIPDWRGLEGSFDQWRYWREKNFSPEEVLTRSCFKIKEVKEFRDWLVAHASFIDPVENFYMLFRLIPYRKRMYLKGKALLSQDYYEFVGIINLFLKDLTKEDQPDPDDILDLRRGSWKKEVFGDPFNYYDPIIRRKIIDEYISDLIPKLFLLLEGDVEEEAIPIIASSMGFYLKARGVEIYNYEGTGGLKGQNIRGTLYTAKIHGTPSYLISDNDEHAKDYINDLIRKGLLKENYYTIWKTEFEEDNFGINKVLDKVNKSLENYGLEKIDIKYVENEMNNRKYLMKSLEDIVWKKFHLAIYDVISKPELGRLLALERAKEIQVEIKRGDYDPKLHIEKVIIEVSKKI